LSQNYIATKGLEKITQNGLQSVGNSRSFLNRSKDLITFFSLRSLATASYRLLPSIEFLADIEPSLHPKLQACFPPGVIDISEGRVRVADARKDTVSREVLRHAEFEDKVRLGRVRDHFICESHSS